MGQRVVMDTKRFIAVSITVLVALPILMIVDGNYNSWSGTMLSNDEISSSWTLSAQTVSGSSTRTVRFDAEALSDLRIDSENKDGEVYFTLKQGDIERAVNISREYDGKIDTSAFEPGRIKMRVDFHKAQKVNFTADW